MSSELDPVIDIEPGSSGRDTPKGYTQINVVGQAREKTQWPFLFWLYLKTLGLYHAEPLVTIRRCAACKEHGLERFSSLSSFISPCDICESFLWDHTGYMAVIKDHDIGASRLNHRGSGVVSMIWLLLLIGCTVFLIGADVLRYESKVDNVVEFMSTICLQLLLTIPSFAAFVCNLYTTWPHCAPGKWASALNPTFLVQRLRCVNMRRSRAAGYFLFFASIFFIALQFSRIIGDLYAYGKSTLYLTPFKYFSLIIGIFNFAGLVYIVYLLRRSYEKEVRLMCKFVVEHIDDIDICRLRLAETFDSFHTFREFMSGWMSMNIVLATIGILLELHVWIVNDGVLHYFHYERLAFLIGCFVLPIQAVGNITVDYLWGRMIRQISRQRRQEQEQHWDKIMQFLQEQRPGERPWQSVMAFLLSTIAVFAGIQFRVLSSKAINSATNFRSLNMTWGNS